MGWCSPEELIGDDEDLLPTGIDDRGPGDTHLGLDVPAGQRRGRHRRRQVGRPHDPARRTVECDDGVVLGGDVDTTGEGQRLPVELPVEGGGRPCRAGGVDGPGGGRDAAAQQVTVVDGPAAGRRRGARRRRGRRRADSAPSSPAERWLPPGHRPRPRRGRRSTEDVAASPHLPTGAGPPRSPSSVGRWRPSPSPARRPSRHSSVGGRCRLAPAGAGVGRPSLEPLLGSRKVPRRNLERGQGPVDVQPCDSPFARRRHPQEESTDGDYPSWLDHNPCRLSPAETRFPAERQN